MEDHGARITIAHKFMKSEAARLNSGITQNATLAKDNNAKIKEGLAHLEAQVMSNGVATAELRKDVQGAFHESHNRWEQHQRHHRTRRSSLFGPGSRRSTARANTLPKQLLTAATRYFNAPKHWLEHCGLMKCTDI